MKDRRELARATMQQYREHSARLLLPAEQVPRVEYGEAALLVDRVATGTLGTGWTMLESGDPDTPE